METTEGSARADAHDLITSHVGLARSLARRFVGRGERTDDLDGVAQLGLVQAAQRFDPDRGVSFASFATVSILGELKRHFRDRTWSVRAPRRLHDRHLQLGEARETLTHRLGRSPTVAECATYLECSDEDVLAAMEAAGSYQAASLDAPAGDDGRALVDTFGDDDRGLGAGLDRLELARALAILDDEERFVLRCYYLDDRTQADIAHELNVSQMYVSRLLARTLARLRHQMANPR